MSDTIPQNEKNRGFILFVIFCLLLILVVLGYVILHIDHKSGLLSPVNPASADALAAAVKANSLLATSQGSLPAQDMASLQDLTNHIGSLIPQLSYGQVISTTLSTINTELVQQSPSSEKLVTLFTDLENELRLRPDNLFWSVGPDRWIEVGFWSLIGTLVFLLSELKFWWSQDQPEFIKYTPWYFANLLRGPFIAALILLALASLSIDIIGITVNVNQAPIEVLIFMAAILGFYSREATQLLDDIVGKIFPGVLEKTRRGRGEQKPSASETKSAAPTESPIDAIEKKLD